MIKIGMHNVENAEGVEIEVNVAEVSCSRGRNFQISKHQHVRRFICSVIVICHF